MRIVQALPGDSAKECLHRLYFRALEKKETLLINFNGVSVLFFQDDGGFNCPIPTMGDLVDAPYLRDVEKNDPTGYVEFEKLHQRNREELASLKQKNRELSEYIRQHRMKMKK